MTDSGAGAPARGGGADGPEAAAGRARGRRSPAGWAWRAALVVLVSLVGTYVVSWLSPVLLGGARWARDVSPDRATWDALAQSGWPGPDDPGMRWITPTLGADAAGDELFMAIGPVAAASDGSVTNYVVVRDRLGPWIMTLERRMSYAVRSAPNGSGGWATTVIGARDTGVSLAGLPLLGVPIPREYAITPVWPGFAVVWILVAVALGLVWWVAVAARPIVRRWRGLCMACGYSLEGLIATVCPECGSPIGRG